jgi:hypothetical protein
LFSGFSAGIRNKAGVQASASMPAALKHKTGLPPTITIRGQA